MTKAHCYEVTDGRSNGEEDYWILHNVLMKVESFIFLADFVIIECEVDFEVPIILGSPYLATGCVLVYMEKGQMNFRLNNEKASFKFIGS